MNVPIVTANVKSQLVRTVLKVRLEFVDKLVFPVHLEASVVQDVTDIVVSQVLKVPTVVTPPMVLQVIGVYQVRMACVVPMVVVVSKVVLVKSVLITEE